jgi:hypothetical protein
MERASFVGWPAYPPELLRELAAARPEGGKLRFVLVGGAALVCTQVVRESEAGVVLETTEGTLTAVPWHMVARVDALRREVGTPVGFRAG